MDEKYYFYSIVVHGRPTAIDGVRCLGTDPADVAAFAAREFANNISMSDKFGNKAPFTVQVFATIEGTTPLCSLNWEIQV